MDINENFECIDEEKIREFVKDKQEENLTLDFKTISNANLYHPDDKKNFAKAMSGFANSSGGIIVWGVEARKNDQDIDCACGFKEIAPLSLFLSKLNEYTGQFVKPIVEGIKHKKIEVTEDKGFAVTFVPESNAGPHMAKAGEDRYYKRSGASFYKMEHFDIEDMLGRRKKPRLSLFVHPYAREYSSGPDGRIFEAGVNYGLRNEGRGLAKYLYLLVEVNLPYIINSETISHVETLGFKVLASSQGNRVRLLGDSNIVIHPNCEIMIGAVTRRINEKAQDSAEDLIFDYEIRAEDMKEEKNRIIINRDKILEKISEIKPRR